MRLRHLWIKEGKPRGNSHVSYYSYKKAKQLFADLFELKQKQFYRNEYEDIENASNIGMGAIWRQLRPRRNTNTGSSINHNGVLYTTPEELCQLWKKRYDTLLNEQPDEAALYDADHLDQLCQTVDDIKAASNELDDPTGILTESFTINEVASICKRLPNNKAPGYDGISYECVKYGGYKLYEWLTFLFNKIINFTYIPQQLKHSVIITLHKGKHKPKNDVNSYRGVSLTPTLNKVLEKVILMRLKPWLASKDFPPPLQQAGRGCTNCVCVSYMVQEAIEHMVDQGSKVYGCFLDIKSAYDIINWKGLLVKLWRLGINGKLWHLFERWLTGSTAHVSIQGISSDSFDITRSIKQGGLLSTFYFVTYYQDIHSFVTKGATQSLRFHDMDIGSPTMADDTLLLSMTARGLQTMIDNAFLYGNLWRLQYSATKTKCIVFGDKKRRAADSCQWNLGNQPLEVVSSYNYLGIILTADMSSRVRSNTMAKRGYANLGMLRSLGFHSDGLSPITCSKIWQMMLIPSMLYGCEVWGKLPKGELKSLEIVQKRVGKHIQGLNRRTHDEIVRGLLGWIRIEGAIDKCKINFFYKLMELPHDNVIKHIFLCQMYCILFAPKSADTNGYTYDLWLTLLKYNLTDLVLAYFAGGPIENKQLWKQIVRCAIDNTEEEVWKDGLIRKGAARFLRIHCELKPHPLYGIIKENMRHRKDLINTIKLIAYPEVADLESCSLCQRDYTDTVEHYIMRCEGMIELRTSVWDVILDCLDCISEATLLRQSDDQLLDTFLSKHWEIFTEDKDYVKFCCTTARELSKMMKVL